MIVERDEFTVQISGPKEQNLFKNLSYHRDAEIMVNDNNLCSKKMIEDQANEINKLERIYKKHSKKCQKKMSIGFMEWKIGDSFGPLQR